MHWLTHYFQIVRISMWRGACRTYVLTVSILLFGALVSAGSAVDELPDITGGVIPLLYPVGGETYGLGSGGQLFSGGRLSQRGDSVYQVRVQNQSGDPIEADSLVVVVHRVQEAARLRDVTTTDKIRILDSDGVTRDGKPYFRVPMGGKSELEPYGMSEAFTLEIRNPDLLRLYPPVLRVRGVRRTASQEFQEAIGTLLEREAVSREQATDVTGESPDTFE